MLAYDLNPSSSLGSCRRGAAPSQLEVVSWPEGDRGASPGTKPSNERETTISPRPRRARGPRPACRSRRVGSFVPLAARPVGLARPTPGEPSPLAVAVGGLPHPILVVQTGPQGPRGGRQRGHEPPQDRVVADPHRVSEVVRE